jgi:rSAM/selenodomain-associated transferase 2
MLAFRRLHDPRLAIVVPALDEEGTLRLLLPIILPLADEVVVSDGGSSDRTVEVARDLGARVVTGPPGRGGQLNRGAAATTAEVLLFLHADTLPPTDAARLLRDAVAAGAVGGGFRMRFDDRRPILRLGEWLIDLRTRLTRLPLGDQAQFATREAFAALGGYRDWPILEDLDLAWRMKRRWGRWRMTIVEERVTTAARRFVEQGVVRTVATNWLIWLLFLLGFPPHRLARLYRHIR